MAGYRWRELYTGPWIVTGNVAKVKVLHELHALMFTGSAGSILDIGCVGPKPFEFWEPLLTTCGDHFHLTGIDRLGIEKAQEVVQSHGWEGRVILRQANGYNLSKIFERESFSVVTSIQVLEHIARLPLFMKQIAHIVKPTGDIYLTVDSAHYKSRFDPRNPVRLVKNLIKKSLSLMGNEKHYDLPWYDYEVRHACNQVGLEIVECRYYNIPILKLIHNHIVPPNQKNAFIQLWFELEEVLNDEKCFGERVKNLFSGLYFHVRKSR